MGRWRRIRRWLIWATALALAIGVPLAWVGPYVYFNVPIMSFRPVCFDRNALAPIPRLREVEGTMTREFVLGVAELATEYKDFTVAIRGRRVFLPMANWLSHWDLGARDIEHSRWVITGAVATPIFRRRRDEGAITDEAMKEYMFIDRWRDEAEPRPLKADECGLLHELVIEGGHFAQPSPPSE